MCIRDRSSRPWMWSQFIGSSIGRCSDCSEAIFGAGKSGRNDSFLWMPGRGVTFWKSENVLSSYAVSYTHLDCRIHRIVDQTGQSKDQAEKSSFLWAKHQCAKYHRNVDDCCPCESERDIPVSYTHLPTRKS